MRKRKYSRRKGYKKKNRSYKRAGKKRTARVQNYGSSRGGIRL